MGVFLCAIFITSCYRKSADSQTESGSLVVAKVTEAKKPPELANKIKNWEPIFFEVIDRKLQKLNLASLKNKEKVEDNLEVRVWVGFGEARSTDVKGFILERNNGNWEAAYLPQDGKGKMAIQSKKPKSGWNVLWENLNSYNFLTIPDITESKDNSFPDATGIVVEIKDSSNYRNYMQVEDYQLEDYPELRTPESIKLTKACRMLSSEFNIPLCS